MQMLDKELSRHVEAARTRPVPVDRYGVPWVWIVSHPLWVEVDHLRAFVPDDHALVSLREAIDSILLYEGVVLSELAGRCTSGADPRMILRAWLLQVVYSLAEPRCVCDALGYNMLWRWFIGYTARSDALPETRVFVQDIEMISADSRVIDMVYRCLTNGSLPTPETGGFCINHGLLHTLRAHHFDGQGSSTEELAGGRNAGDE